MTPVRLFPRLGAASAQVLLAELVATPITLVPPLSAYVARGFTMAGFAATGGTRGEDCVREIVCELRSFAIKCGMTQEAAGRSLYADFDKRAARYLGACPLLGSGEALRDDVWAFISIVMLPDVVAWRFPSRSPSRFNGGVRNAFQRLWMRGHYLDRGDGHQDRWGLVSHLTEDAMVQIFERPSIPATPGLAPAIAEVWIDMAREHGRGAMEEITRIAIKMLRIKNEIVDLSMLPHGEITMLIKDHFEMASRVEKLA